MSALFGGLLDEMPWEGFLRSFAAWIGANYAILILTAPGTELPGTIVTPDSDPKRAGNYAESYFSLDPFTGLPEGQVMAFSEFVGGEFARDSDFYKEFLIPAGGDQILGVDLHLESGFEARVRATRDGSRPDFGKKERAAFQSLVPHLRHAVRIFERLQEVRAEHGVYRGAVEQMGVGTIILDRSGNVLRTNAVADKIMAAKDGLSIVAGRLQFNAAEARKSLDEALRALDSDSAAHRFRVVRPSGARPLVVVAKTVASPSFLRNGGGALLALLVSDPGEDYHLLPEAVGDLFQLTRMEATLATAVASGRSLVEAADSLGIAHNTARSHLRAIFAKTGARSQSQLVHLLHRGIQ